MQAPAALSENIDSPDDGDLVMFHGKHFYFMDAIGPAALLPAPEAYYPQQVGLPPPTFAHHHLSSARCFGNNAAQPLFDTKFANKSWRLDQLLVDEDVLRPI
mgnify:CR=1 FL=1